jgi:Di-haem oxidoreductase, putative peroxidase
MRAIACCILTVVGLLSLGALAKTETQIPRIWDDAALEEWATPIAALNIRPGHYTSAEYYQVPADNLRTYPVYPPDKEPAGYWEWLQQQKPAPLVDAASIHSAQDWIAAGERAFREMDKVTARTSDPQILRLARDPATFASADTLPDGSILDLRWIVTERGVQITIAECSACHRHIRSDKSVLFAGPPDGPGERSYNRPRALIGPVRQNGSLRDFAGVPPGEFFWRRTATPWAPDERVERIRGIAHFTPELQAIVTGKGGAVFLRPNGSPFYGTKIPDLHTTHYSRYLDATGTHRLRGAEDIGRYAALITGADSLDFGPHHMLLEKRHIAYRYADEVLNALGMYVMSLEPPRNANAAPQEALDRGEQIFRREGCARCHTPPNYTTGGLTLATGYRMPPSHPNRSDVLSLTAETDPALALKTRKGTGFYKIPSLRGVWYRPRLMHDGALTSLEEMFDPARQSPDYEPRGWNPVDVTKRAIAGHPFGLAMPSDDKRALIAFLRSL